VSSGRRLPYTLQARGGMSFIEFSGKVEAVVNVTTAVSKNRG